VASFILASEAGKA
jgi:putative SOS response-associated peptidase YedK